MLKTYFTEAEVVSVTKAKGKKKAYAKLAKSRIETKTRPKVMRINREENSGEEGDMGKAAENVNIRKKTPRTK
jgi:hypothetical protein